MSNKKKKDSPKKNSSSTIELRRISLTKAIDSPIRRKILSFLSCQPHYTAQLSRMLRTSPMAIKKHVEMLLRSKSIKKRSDVGKPESRSGPDTVNYEISRPFSVFCITGQKFFDFKEIWLDDIPDKTNIDKECTDLIELNRALLVVNEEYEEALGNLFQIAKKKDYLLQQGQRIISSYETHERRLLHAMLCRGNLLRNDLSSLLARDEAEVTSALETLVTKELVDIDDSTVRLKEEER